jgi:hypothetical protein
MSGEARKAATLAEAAQRAEVRRVRVWWTLVVGFLGLGLGILMAFAFIIQTSRDQRAATCAVIHANQEVYRETPPVSDVGRNAQRAWDDLAHALKCN